MTTFPVTNSILSPKELGEFIKDRYRLHKNFNCKLFRIGMNHTYFLTDGKTTYVVRAYSYNWRSEPEIVEEIKLLNLLKDNKLCVSFPLPDKNGEFIQNINAPEGIRYVVLFSFAQGNKMRFLDRETCFSIGSLMAKMHNITSNRTINRTSYNNNILLARPYEYLKKYFSEKSPDMEFIKKIGEFFEESDFKNIPMGVVHMDIWYDNMAVTNEKVITIFDFDFCGNGPQILDVGYFCKHLFHIEQDRSQYELKKKFFLEGYQSIRLLSDYELKLIPKAGLAVFVFYLGVQALRFDWSNIFLSENYLKIFYVERLKSWMEYNDIEKVK